MISAPPHVRFTRAAVSTALLTAAFVSFGCDRPDEAAAEAPATAAAPAQDQLTNEIILPPGSWGPCRVDEDCRAVADYCSGGCKCRALSRCLQDPVCKNPVQCLVDPCRGEEAVCAGGRCALRGAAFCERAACGPPLGIPNVVCPDGKTVSGPTGRCIRHPSGACGWEIARCPGPGDICRGPMPL